MKQLLIVNKGRLEPEALTLLGASTKRGDKSKIGQFGSGNKYALAYLLKHGHKVKITSGDEEIKIGIVVKTFREQDFEVLVINDKETSITLDFGYKWTLWQAIRELYTNALDEGLIYFGMRHEGETLVPYYDEETKTPIEPDSPGITTISIEVNADVEDFWFNIRDYIARDLEVLFECEAGKIYRKHNSKTCIYFRGVRCYETQKESIFDYDLNDVEIDENRLIKYSWGLPEALWKIIFKCNDAVIMRTLLQEVQNVKMIENEIDGMFVSVPEIENKQEWKNALQGQSIVPRDLGSYVKDEDRAATLFLPSKLYTGLVAVLGNGVKSKSFTISSRGTLFTTFVPDAIQQSVMKQAKFFFEECRYVEPLSHPILTVQFDDKKVYGSISEDGEILISDVAIADGAHMVVTTIIEEHLHLKSKAPDKSREFQNAIITEFVNYMKTLHAFTL